MSKEQRYIDHIYTNQTDPLQALLDHNEAHSPPNSLANSGPLATVWPSNDDEIPLATTTNIEPTPDPVALSPFSLTPINISTPPELQVAYAEIIWEETEILSHTHSKPKKQRENNSLFTALQRDSKAFRQILSWETGFTDIVEGSINFSRIRSESGTLVGCALSTGREMPYLINELKVVITKDDLIYNKLKLHQIRPKPKREIIKIIEDDIKIVKKFIAYGVSGLNVQDLSRLCYIAQETGFTNLTTVQIDLAGLLEDRNNILDQIKACSIKQNSSKPKKEKKSLTADDTPLDLVLPPDQTPTDALLPSIATEILPQGSPLRGNHASQIERGYFGSISSTQSEPQGWVSHITQQDQRAQLTKRERSKSL